MKKIIPDMYYPEHLEYCVSEKPCFPLPTKVRKMKNRESRILLSTYLDTDFGWCELFKGGANVPQSS